jgi:GNAT superfamily N-acetyltransferase
VTAFVIRRGRPEDARGLAELFAAVAEERDGIATEPPVDVDARTELFAASIDGTIVAIAADDFVGSLHVDATRFGVGEFGMAVARPWRGRGVGSALLTAAIEKARADGLHELSLEVFPPQRGGDRPLPQVRLRRGGPPREALPPSERRALGLDSDGSPPVTDAGAHQPRSAS